MTTLEGSSKRKRLEVDEKGKDFQLETHDRVGVIGGNFKRPKPVTSAEGTLRCEQTKDTPKFQHFHLDLLRSLYAAGDDNYEHNNDHNHQGADSSDGESQADSNGTTEKDTVDGLVWLETRKFIQERERMRKEKCEASHLKNIHQEAVDFIEERESASKTPASPAIATASGNGPFWYSSKDQAAVPLSALSAGRHDTSPYSFAYFSPLRCSGPGPSQQFSLGDERAHCFGLVATLLGRKFRTFERSAERRSDPYQPLLRVIEDKIEALQTKLAKRQEDYLTERRATVEDLLAGPVYLSSSQTARNHGYYYHRRNIPASHVCSNMAKLETKIQLWSMLASDLKTII
jgi:hypothetical protein